MRKLCICQGRPPLAINVMRFSPVFFLLCLIMWSGCTDDGFLSFTRDTPAAVIPPAEDSKHISDLTGDAEAPLAPTQQPPGNRYIPEANLIISPVRSGTSENLESCLVDVDGQLFHPGDPTFAMHAEDALKELTEGQSSESEQLMAEHLTLCLEEVR